MQEELLQFQIQKVWILVDLPFGKKAIRTKWVFRNKKDERGVVVRNKARLVAQGHRQEEGIDYDEVFSPVARIESIRIFLAFAYYMGFIVYQMDVKSALLYGKINEEVYVTQPPGFVDPKFPNKVYKVVKALYGLHQAPRAWYATFSTSLEQSGYIREAIDKTLFIKQDKKDIMLTSHLQAVKRIFSYLKGQPKLGLWYPKVSSFDLEAYSNSDYASVNLDIFLPLHDDSKMEVIQAYDTVPPPQVVIALPAILPPFLVLSLSPMFDSQDLFPSKEISPKDTKTPFESPIPVPPSSLKGSSSPVRVGKGFLGVETPLFATILVQPQYPAVEEDDEVETYATLSQKVAHLEKDKIAQALEIIKLKKRVKKLKKQRRTKSSGLKRLRKVGGRIEAIDADEEITLVDMEIQANLDAEVQGMKDDDNAAIKEASAAEPTVFDDEEVTMTMAQTLIKMKAEKSRLLDEQMAKRLHDEEVEQAMQEKHLDNIRKYQSLKRKPIYVAQAKKNMIVYLKNIAGYKMEHFKESLSPQVVSAAMLPILNPNEFDLWKMRNEQYFLMTNYSLWERLARKNELKARGTLLMASPDKHQLKFNIHNDATTLMEAIKKRFGGNKDTKKVQKTPFKQQYENFTGSGSESLDQIHDRLHKLISQLEILGESLSQEDINLKFLRSLPTEWRTHTLIWRNKTYLKEQSLDDLFNNLKIYEAEVKSSSFARLHHKTLLLCNTPKLARSGILGSRRATSWINNTRYILNAKKSFETDTLVMSSKSAHQRYLVLGKGFIPDEILK
nr:putative ribonuclease H-like domain-containing protein [Tanacetum cinerariifolium]